jgi:hypothetical protein
MLPLAKFVSEAIKEVIYGVQVAKSAAQGAGGDVGGLVGACHSQTGQFFVQTSKSDAAGSQRYVSEITFDVAVTVSEDSGSKDGAAIFVVPIGPGTREEPATTSTNASRMRFTVPLVLP